MDWSRHFNRIVGRRLVYERGHGESPRAESGVRATWEFNEPAAGEQLTSEADEAVVRDETTTHADSAPTNENQDVADADAIEIVSAVATHRADNVDSPTVFFSVGEPSGDFHAANLIRAIHERQPSARFVGYGGPEMARAGCELHTDLTALAVMWILRVLLNLHRFLKLLVDADRYFAVHRPDAVVLVDYPGFNWWIARRAKARGIPVFYYCPPQIWAWAGWRIGKMRRLVDHVLCTLPFEARWFEDQGCRAEFVGHPYFDEVRRHDYDVAFVARETSKPGPLVTILPGSRSQEVHANLVWFLAAARLIRRRVPGARFAIAAYRPTQAEYAREKVAEAGIDVDVHVNRTPELMQAADCCMAVSGSVSLELLHHTKPTVILYRISRTAHRVQRHFRKARYITLVNLLAADADLGVDVRKPVPEEAMFPEFLAWKDASDEIAEHIVAWLRNDESRNRRIAELAKLRDLVSHGGASARAAEYILRQIRPVRCSRGSRRAATRLETEFVAHDSEVGTRVA